MPSETSGPDQPAATPPPTPSGLTTTPSEAGQAHESSGLSTGGIAGVAIGAAVILLLAGSLVYVCGRHGGFEKGYYRRSKDAILPGSGGSPSSLAENGSSGSTEPMFLPAAGIYADDCCNSSVANTTSPMGQYAIPAGPALNQNHFMNQSQRAPAGPWSPESLASPPQSSSQRSTFQFQAYRPPGYVSSAASVSTQAPLHSYKRLLISCFLVSCNIWAVLTPLLFCPSL
jgi:hypothetical protein